jgi:hypothetical protein
MAVVQISRIQIRRGKAKDGTGLPQLASGEMAWAVDTQQLYIGNGSVAEGSPAVGNTRLLTENDLSSYSNLLGLLSYTYKSTDSAIITGASANSPIQRTFQLRLDDRVNTADFGTVSNGTTDDTAALQRAVDQLFLNPSHPSFTYDSSYPTGIPAAVSTRNTLEIPAGIYYTSNTIYVPSYTTLRGPGADKAIIYFNPTNTYTGSTTATSATVVMFSARVGMVGATITGPGIQANTTIISFVAGQSITLSNAATSTNVNTGLIITVTGPAVQFVNDSSTIGVPSAINFTQGVTQPRNISISGLTVHCISGKNTCLQLDSVRDSIFENIILQGDWVNTFNANCSGIVMNATTNLVTCENNTFRNIVVNSFSYGVYAKYDILNNRFENCYFGDMQQAISFGKTSNGSTSNQVYGPRQTQIVGCKFYNIKQQGVYIERGKSNTVTNCKFINVGNNGSGNAGAIYPHIYYNEFGNSADNNFSDRADVLLTSVLTTPYVPELAGHGIYRSFGTNTVLIGYHPASVFLFRLPVSTDYVGNPTGSINYVIDYYYLSNTNSFSRRGKLTISADIVIGKLQLSDEFDYGGLDPSNLVAIVLDFNATFLDRTGAVYTGAVGQVPYSIAINYVNSLTNDAGTMGFTYTAQQ